MFNRILSLMLFLMLLLIPACSLPSEKTAEMEIELYPATAQVDGEVRWGYINGVGEFVIPPTWEVAEPFTAGGAAVVMLKDRLGFINVKGEVVQEPKYTAVAPYHEGLTAATTDFREYDILDESGTVLFTRTGVTGYYQEGLVGVQNPDGLFGYADRTGKDVIVPQFSEAGEFVQGKALVKTPAGEYRLIDPKGAVLQVFPYETMWSAGEGLYAHGITGDDGALRYGYVDSRNAVILEAELDEVGDFNQGLAVVGRWGEEGPQRGLVNVHGEFVVPMEYGALNFLGDGLYAAVRKTWLDSYQAVSYHQGAVMDGAGKLLTPEAFYHLSLFDTGILSASDGTATFLINSDGTPVSPAFSVPGVGILSKQGGVIKAEIDNEIRYYTDQGKLIWQQERSRTYPAVTVTTASKRFDRFTFVEYPIVSGTRDTAAAARINQALEALILSPNEGVQADPEYPVDTQVTFTDRVLGGLLEIQVDGYAYPLGAAHGTGWSDTLYFDLSTGDRYRLEDLFLPESGYGTALAQIIQELIPLGPLAGSIEPDQIGPIAGDHPFRLQEGGLEIYYQVYELAPYAAGQPSFTIPWSRLGPLIDQKGPCWQAYNN